jgi:hypothetical protein
MILIHKCHMIKNLQKIDHHHFQNLLKIQYNHIHNKKIRINIKFNLKDLYFN